MSFLHDIEVNIYSKKGINVHLTLIYLHSSSSQHASSQGTLQIILIKSYLDFNQVKPNQSIKFSIQANPED